jgi:O-antigen/teichoic acid export membrane protein
MRIDRALCSLGSSSTSRVLEQKPKPVAASFVSNVAAVTGGQVACAVLGLVSEICYARFLGPQGRGQISLCLMLIVFGVLVAGMGGEGTIILWRAHPERNAKPWLPAVLFWGLLGCVLTCGLGAAAYWRWHPAFVRGVSGSLAAIVLISIPISVLFDYQLALLVGEERFRARAVVAVISQLAGLAGFATLLLFARTAKTALWGNFLGVLAGLLVTSLLVRESFRNFWRLRTARENFFPTLSFALRGQFGLVASFFNYRLDVFIVNYFLDSAQLGLYALGVAISEALWQIPTAAAIALFPRTARTASDGAADFTCRLMRQVLLLATAGALVTGIAAGMFLPLVFGERFRPSIAVVWLLLPGTLALCLGRVAASDLSGRGHSGYSSVFSVAALVVTIVLDLILIPRLGIDGAALASSAAYLTNAILLLSALKHEIRVTWRSLLVPKRADWASYWQAWLRLRDWVRGTAMVPSGQPE